MNDHDWGPWTAHDGGPAPKFPDQTLVMVGFSDKSLKMPPDSGDIYLDWPCWHWRWQRRRVGWFKSERIRVCDDPAYSPIVAYRLRRPRGMAVLLGLLENLPANAPEGGGEVGPVKRRMPQRVP